MQMITLIGKVTDDPKECVRKGRKVLSFRVAAGNSPTDTELTEAEFDVVSPRFPAGEGPEAGDEVLVYGMLALGQGLIPYTLVTAVMVRVVGLNRRKRAEMIADFLSEGITTEGLW